MPGPSLLLLGGAAPSQGLRCVQQARARGLRVILTDTAENLAAVPDIVAAASTVLELPYDDPERCVAWAQAQAAAEGIVGVFGFREYAVMSVAAVAEALGLPGNGTAAARTVRDKHRCREALRLLGFAQPLLAECRSAGEALAFAREHPAGAWIMKPPAAMGSLGVRRVRDPDELRRAFAEIATSGAGIGPGGEPRVLIEEVQAGKELSAEGLFVAGAPHVLALTAKHLVGDGCFVERGHVMPAQLPPALAALARTTVESALTALGLTWGVFHVELWLDQARVVLGEVHARPGGDYLHWMMELLSGVDTYGAVFDQLLGRLPDPSSWRLEGALAILYFTPTPGVVRRIAGLQAAALDPSCVRLDLPLTVGSIVAPLRESRDRPGFVLARGETPAEAWRAAQRLYDLVEMEVGPAPGFVAARQ